MPETKWYPHVTVAAVIKRDNKFLIVEEPSLGEQVFNQPAGHVEQGEALVAAVIREVLEETGFEFTPTALVGFYHFKAANGVTYLRFSFKGDLGKAVHEGPIDSAISAIHWLTKDELAATNLRSTIVMPCIQDYLEGRALGLEHLQSFEL
jgi:ADP-ribose pyrophosphatase YjhB (NUDIX family)